LLGASLKFWRQREEKAGLFKGNEVQNATGKIQSLKSTVK
jgi:hypothetical protein